MFGESSWEEYVTVANLRNPWDKVLSQYFHLGVQLQGRSPAPLTRDIDEYVESLEVPLVELEIAKTFRVDRCLRHEKLEDDCLSFCRELGMPLPKLDFPRLKQDTRPKDARGYRHLYSSTARARVGELYSPWVELGHYTF